MTQLPLSASPELVGDSPRIRQIRALIRKVGRSDSPVLLLGETGTGKEVVARAIHHERSAGPFVPIECSVLGTLLETELFGHVRGAFTGAIATKTGLLELAAGGTAFFDEIGELPLDVQAKLLRVLQEREFRPLGSLERRKASFRPMAATNRDLAREVEQSRFRRDLFYRLNVVTLRLPPLRERKEDIPELVDHFLNRCAGGHKLAPQVMEALQDYDWPGNVRELENCIQRMVALNSGPWLTPADLPSSVVGTLDRRQPVPAGAAAVACMAQAMRTSGNLALSVPRLELVEKQAILDALALTRGDRARAAELLGIGRTTLYRKLKTYGE